MKRILFTLLAVSLVACQTTETATDVNATQEATPPTKVEPAKVSKPVEAMPPEPLVFMDSWVFDQDLSSNLNGSHDNIEVSTRAKMTLNDIPDRMDKWLSKVKETGGTVQAQAIESENGTKTRGIFSVLIDVVLFFVGRAKEEVTFGPAEQYDATLHFDEPTGIIKRVVFTRRDGK